MPDPRPNFPWGRRSSDGPPVLPESLWLRRREILRALGYGGLLLGGGRLAAVGQDDPEAKAAAEKKGFSFDTYPPSERFVPKWAPAGGADLYPAARNASFTGGRALAPEDRASTLNNFYEFLPGRSGPVHKHAKKFVARPWEVTIAGLVEEERTVDVDELARIAPLEERIYRFRCVEAWSMVVPWTGIPLARVVAWCRPKPEARFVRFVSFNRPDQAPGQKRGHYPWPYYEGLRMDETMHPLAFLATGIYGHGLPTQHGAPVRIVVPWKYGYKSPKSIVRIEFTAQRPRTFWTDMEPNEYPFLSNVNPAVPHPRWSQEREEDVTTGDRIATQPYNGYAADVASLYAE